MNGYRCDQDAPQEMHGAGVNIAHVDVEFSDIALKDSQTSVKQLRSPFLKLPGVAPNIGGFISHMITISMFFSVKSFPATIAIIINLPLALVGGNAS
ncbi:MAG: hypothetical protein QNJ64_02320 [Crocosphaera sp.]|nr:hypothetical protein [Crocosphaera sp.]